MNGDPQEKYTENEGWKYYMPQPNRTFELMNKDNGNCLGERTPKEGGVSIVAPCSGARGQQWEFGYTNFDGSSYVNVESGLCLAADGTGGSVTFELKSCDEQPNQLWNDSGTS